MIALALPCDGRDSSRRWFESHQSFFCLSTLLRLVSKRYFLAVRLWNCKFIYCKITYLSWVLRRYQKSWLAVEKCLRIVLNSLNSLLKKVSKNTSLIWQISFNGQRCDLQIHHCFLNDRSIACSWYIKNRKKPCSRSFYFLFKIFLTKDIIYPENKWDLLWRKPKIGICLLTVQVEMVGKC